ncbi:unnamed protein product [Closterium sp. NIES-53]
MVVTTSDVVFYEKMLVEVWKSEHGPASGWTQVNAPTDTSTTTLPLFVEVGELADEDAEVVRPSSPSPAPPAPPLVADLLTFMSANGDEGRSGSSPMGPAKSIASGRCDSGAEESTDSDVVEVPPGPLRSGRERRPPEFLSYHACLPPAVYTTVYDEVDDDLLYDDAEEEVELPELDPNMHADHERRWDIATMSVKEALASWKGKVVKAAMVEEIRSLIGKGTWELVEHPPGVNIMKNWWVLMTKYRIDDTVEREKARLVMKGFTQVYIRD